MLRHFRFILIFVVLVVSTFKDGLIAQHIQEESNVTALKNYFRQYYSSRHELQGYRIQISSTTDRRKMESLLGKFRYSYPGMKAEWKYSAPYYRIIVGVYLTKREAQEKAYSLNRDFPGSIIVFDQIEKTEFLH